MTRFVLRKLGGEGRLCVAWRKLAELLRAELGQCSAAVQAGEGASTFVGNDLGQVMQRVEGEVAKGAAEVEVLLIPPVAGGQPSPREAFEAMTKTGEVHVLAEITGLELSIVPDEVVRTERLVPIDFVFKFFRMFPSAQMRLQVYSYRKAIKRDFTHAQDWHDIYDEGYRRAYLGTMRRDSGGQYYLRDFLSTRGQTSLLGDSDGSRYPDELKLGWEDTVREVVEACGAAIRDGQELTLDFARKFARFVSRSWGVSERRSFETLKRTLGEEVAEELLREGRVSVRSRDGREYVITAGGEVFVSKGDGLRYVCVQVAGEEMLPRLDRVLAKYLVIRDQPERICTLREAVEHCTRCGREIRLGDVHAAVTLEEEVFEGRGRDYDVDVTDAETLCLFCNKCHQELRSRGAFGQIEELLSRPQYTAVVIQEEHLHEFVGVDLRVHGPFRRGEVACLPKANAEAMIRRGEARELEVTSEGGACPICGGEVPRAGAEHGDDETGD